MTLYDYAQAQKDMNTVLGCVSIPGAIQSIPHVAPAKANDIINSPNHYARGRFEVWDIIEFFKLNYNLGNVCKYILRAGVKTANPLEDYKKARAYLDREIAILEGRIDVRPN